MPANENLNCSQRETFSRKVSYRAPNMTTPINLTGATVEAQVRKRPNDANLLAQFTCALNGTLGEITISLSSAQTAALPIGKLAYDIVVTLAGETFVLVQGDFVVDGTVTKGA